MPAEREELEHVDVVIPEPRAIPDFDATNKLSTVPSAPPSQDKPQLQLLNIPDLSALPPDKEHASSVVLLLQSGTTPELLAIPGFPRCLTAPCPLLYHISSAKQSGLGMFASAPIKQGQLILCERPLIVYPQLVPFHSGRPPGQQYPELEDAVNRIPAPNQKAFYTLMNAHPDEPCNIKGIIDTNALHLGCLPGSTHQYAAVCKDISRVNHSCSPNATYHFDIRTFTFHLRALLPIPTNAQIYISYIDPALPRSARQRTLSSYGFTCACPTCSLPEPLLSQSEARRALISRADADITARNAALERWARDPRVPDDYVNLVDRMYVDLFEKEGLYYEPVWEGFVGRLCKACCAVEDAEGAKGWARLAAGLNRAYTGGDRGWDAVADSPHRTGWWGRRIRAKATDALQRD